MKKSKGKKAYIFTVTAGAGHVKAGEALKEAFAEVFPHWDVEIFDVLDYTNALFKRRYAKSYTQLINTIPELWGLLYDKTDDIRIAKRIAGLRNFFNSLNAAKLIRLVKKYPPDLAICTHFLPAEVLSGLAKKEEIHFPWTCVVTDFEVHRFWMNEKTNLYVVPTELAKFQLERNGTPKDQIAVLGIPIHPKFTIEKSREALMQQMGLNPDLKTILFMSGGFGVGPVAQVSHCLDRIEVPVQIIIVVGKNAELENKLKQRSFKNPTQVLGFVNNVEELFTVADLLVSKPGGLTTSEAMAKGLPMVIVNAIPGQESRNSDFLMENGAAISVASPEDIGFKVGEILRQAGRIESMRTHAKALAKPFAAKHVLEEIRRRWF